MEKSEADEPPQIPEQQSGINIADSERKKKLVITDLSWILKNPPIEPNKLQNSNFTPFCPETEDNLILSTSENYIQDYRCLAMCQLPGRKKSSASKKPNLKLKKDFKKMNEEGVTHIVNLINLYEMRSKGVHLKDYLKLCEKFSIEAIHYEINSMASPKDTPEKLSEELLERLKNIIESGGKIVVHCQAGVGRAGTIISCLLLKLGVFNRAQDVIKYLRKVRYPGCVESSRQMKYVKEFSEMLYGPEKKINLMDGCNYEKSKKDKKFDYEEDKEIFEKKSLGKRRLPSSLYKYRKLDEIIDRLYISSAMEASMNDKLEACEITHILISAKNLVAKFPKDYVYHQLPMQDLKKVKLKDFFIRAFKFIDINLLDDSENKVLVHCLAGASRSVSLVVAYLMLKFKLKFKDALKFVKKKRTQASPNAGFKEQLKLFQNDVEEYWKQNGDFSEFTKIKDNKINEQYFELMFAKPLNLVLLSKILKSSNN